MCRFYGPQGAKEGAEWVLLQNYPAGDFITPSRCRHVLLQKKTLGDCLMSSEGSKHRHGVFQPSRCQEVFFRLASPRMGQSLIDSEGTARGELQQCDSGGMHARLSQRHPMWENLRSGNHTDPTLSSGVYGALLLSPL